MRKATFGSVLTFVMALLIAIVALIVVWTVLEKVFNFSAGVLLGAAGKAVCSTATNVIPGGPTLGFGAGAGILAAGACIVIEPCGLAMGIGATILAAAGGAFLGSNACK